MMSSARSFLGSVLFLSVALFAMGTAFVQAQSNASFPVSVLYGDDDEPPTIPGPVIVTPVAPTQIDIEWGASTDNVAVAGYQLFRNALQIATTTATFFSDTGLQASTTYAYTVIAFDLFGNFSTSSEPVATTTLALPPEPDPEDEPTIPAVRSGSSATAELSSFELTPTAHGARVDFTTYAPTRFEIRYGTDESLSDGFVQGSVFARSHLTSLAGLTPSTTYFFEVVVYDARGIGYLVQAGQFTTTAAVEATAPPNVRNFQAVAIHSDVLLSWENPTERDFAYVRIVRNHRFFPLDQFDGHLVYQGPLERLTDSGALSQFAEQYYTIFTFDFSGNVSSGAIALARSVFIPPTPAPDPIEPEPPAEADDEDEVAEEPSVVLPGMRAAFADIRISQADQFRSNDGQLIEITAGQPFLFQVPYDRFPPHLKIITVTLAHPDEPFRTFSFLLRANAEKEFYEAYLGHLTDPGRYQVTLTVFDLRTEILTTIGGELLVSPPPPPPREMIVTGQEWFAGTFYLFLLLAALVALILLWRLLLLIGRRRRAEEGRIHVS